MNDLAAAIWKQYQNGLNYFERSGLKKEWKDSERFYEGDQWPKVTKNTRNLPRPVVNICSMIADNKKASILSDKLKMVYRPTELFGDRLDDATIGANIFTKFTENLSKELKLDDLNDEAMDYATQLGTYIYHFFWDKDITGGMETPYVGSVRGEILSPENVIVSNPREMDIQKQKYIIIASIESLSSVKKLAKLNKVNNISDIVSDHEIVDEATKELEVCTVLTKYSKKNGKVIWSKTTKNVVIQEPTFWEPDQENIKLDNEEIDDEGSEMSEPDKPIKNQNNNSLFINQKYPVVFKPYKKRKNCIYGIGEVAPAIQNNKAVNFNLAMMLFSVQQTAWPKIIQKAGALARQQVTNAPGEILTDNSKGQSWGFRYMDVPGFNSQALTLTDSLINLTRTTTGSSEVTTGEVMGANMAASAIIALQNQAKKPIEMYQKNFKSAYQDIGKIFEQFYKYYYNDNREFGYEEDGQVNVTSMNGEQFKDIDFSLDIDVGSAGEYSDSLTINLLDTLKSTGDIDLDEYIELYPDNVMVFKSRLVKMIQKKKEEAEFLQQQMSMIQDQETIEPQDQPIVSQA